MKKRNNKQKSKKEKTLLRDEFRDNFTSKPPHTAHVRADWKLDPRDDEIMKSYRATDFDEKGRPKKKK